MKKVLCFAAAAMALFASCQKTEVVYDNDDPQEIALFAVNKVATKAPVTGEDFLKDDNMRVSAYLAAVTGSTPASYFENILFEGDNETEERWVGGQYWPLSDATLNFLAVTQKGGGVAATSEFAYTTPNKGTFTVTVENNEAFNQSDVMYAAATAIKTGNTAADAALKFNHALAWINFQFKTNVDEDIIKVNSITLHAKYNGTLTVTDANYNRTSGNATLTAEWDDAVVDNTNIVDQLVPNNANTAAAGELVLDKDETVQPYGNGLLVVPTTDADYNNSFEISYSIMQSKTDGSTAYVDYTYNHVLNADWEMGKKYTYNITLNLHEIKVNPSVADWDTDTNNDDTLGNDDIPVTLG